MAVVSALFPIPKIALVPLFIIWFGIGEGSKIATLAFGVFFPTVIATAGGVDAVPRGLIRMAQSFGAAARRSSRKIVLPGALPAILSGFRVTASIAIILLVAAEMIGAERGIGAFVLPAGQSLRHRQSAGRHRGAVAARATVALGAGPARSVAAALALTLRRPD